MLEEGVWRTVGGHRIFIKEGQSLSDAMKQSGKFKNTKGDNKKEDLEEDIEKGKEDLQKQNDEQEQE